MSVSHRYPDFSVPVADAQVAAAANGDLLEDTKLASFEKGYSAGWEDAVMAHEAALEKATLEIAQSMQDMSFTYHEAYSKLALAMKPMLTEFVIKLMPSVCRLSLGPVVVQEVTALIEEQVQGTVEIATTPDTAPLLEQALTGSVVSPFVIVHEPLLSDGQVYVRLNTSEREINLDGVMASVSEAVDAFFHHAEQEIEHNE